MYDEFVRNRITQLRIKKKYRNIRWDMIFDKQAFETAKRVTRM